MPLSSLSRLSSASHREPPLARRSPRGGERAIISPGLLKGRGGAHACAQPRVRGGPMAGPAPLGAVSEGPGVRPPSSPWAQRTDHHLVPPDKSIETLRRPQTLARLNEFSPFQRGQNYFKNLCSLSDCTQRPFQLIGRRPPVAAARVSRARRGARDSAVSLQPPEGTQ